MGQRFPAAAAARSVVALTAAAALACRPSGDAGSGTEDLAALDRDLPGWMVEASVPGLAIAVVTSESLWFRTYGVASVESGAPVTAGTLFEAASLSKPVFARMVLAEVERGTLELDAPLTRYWVHPDLEGQDGLDDITGRIVLSHRSGLPNWRRGSPLEIQFEPGSRFQYSGEGYVFLERTLAHLRGNGLEERVRESVLEPLGMGQSSFLFDLDAPGHAVPHDEEGRPLEKRPAPPPGNPAASLHTTAGDYGLFVQALLREARQDRETFAATAAELTDVADGVGWGLGWGLEHPDGRPQAALWHWGDNGPFKAFVYLDPVADRGFVFFANAQNGLALTRGILQRLFPGDHPLLAWLDYDQLDVGNAEG